MITHNLRLLSNVQSYIFKIFYFVGENDVCFMCSRFLSHPQEHIILNHEKFNLPSRHKIPYKMKMRTFTWRKSATRLKMSGAEVDAEH